MRPIHSRQANWQHYRMGLALRNHFSSREWNDKANEIVRFTGELVIEPDKFPEEMKKRLASHIKRGYTSALKTPFTDVYELMCLWNPVFTMEPGNLTSRCFLFPFRSAEDRSEFVLQIDSFNVVASNRKQSVTFQSVSDRLTNWYCEEGQFGRSIPPAFGKLAKQYFDKWRPERKAVCDWLLGKPEPIVTQVCSVQGSTKLRGLIV